MFKIIAIDGRVLCEPHADSVSAVNEILAQNRAILEMNTHLLKALTHAGGSAVNALATSRSTTARRAGARKAGHQRTRQTPKRAA